MTDTLLCSHATMMSRSALAPILAFAPDQDTLNEFNEDKIMSDVAYGPMRTRNLLQDPEMWFFSVCNADSYSWFVVVRLTQSIRPLEY